VSWDIQNRDETLRLGSKHNKESAKKLSTNLCCNEAVVMDHASLDTACAPRVCSVKRFFPDEAGVVAATPIGSPKKVSGIVPGTSMCTGNINSCIIWDTYVLKFTCVRVLTEPHA
jgi:hypothetical protein